MIDLNITSRASYSESIIDIDDTFTPLTAAQTYTGAAIKVNLDIDEGTETGTNERQAILIDANDTAGDVIDIDLDSDCTGATMTVDNNGTGDFISYQKSSTEVFSVNDDGEMKIKMYSQDAEPTLTEDEHLALWKDTNDSDTMYLIFRRGNADQVKLTFA